MQLDAQGHPIFLLSTNPHGSIVTSIDPRGLPPGWRQLLDASGEAYFCCDREDVGFQRGTTYTDPRGLPDGFEIRLLGRQASTPGSEEEGGPIECYVDHKRKLTQWEDPREGLRASSLRHFLRRDLLDDGDLRDGERAE